MVKLRTDTMKPNNPGLSYVTPQGLTAKFNTTGAVVKGIDEGLKAATAFDEMNVMKTAEERAKQLSDTYLNNSPSEVNYYQQQKQTAIDNLTTDKDNPVFLDMLEKAESKLELAFEQGAISGYEFTQRSKAVAEEIMSNNPAYADEIMAKMNDVYARTGVMDTIKLDDAALKAQSTAKNKVYEGMVTFLETKDILTAGKPFEEVEKEYNKYADEVKDINEWKMNIENLKYMNEEQQARMREAIQSSPGGIYGRVNLSLSVYQDEINDVLKKPISNDEKRIELNRIRGQNINALSGLVGLFGKEKYTALSTNNVESINQMHATALDMVSNKSNAEDLKNNLSISQSVNELQLRTTYNPELQKYNLQNAQIFKLIKDLSPQFAFNPTETNELFRGFTDSLSRNTNGEVGARIDINETPEFNDVFNDSFLNQLPITGRIAQEVLTETGDIPFITRGHLNNVFNVTEKLGDSPLRKIQTDKLIQQINRLPKQVHEFMIKNTQDYQNSNVETENYYKGLVKEEILANVNDNKELPELYLNKDLGTISTSNPKYRSVASRITNYITFKARLRGLAPKDIIEETLKEDFPRLMYPSVSSDEDYSKIDVGKMFIDDSGVAKIKEKE
tara:strand:- start:840 stop:2693 length:1854 start_codon:yes stop_codon:yes gene_type:complete